MTDTTHFFHNSTKMMVQRILEKPENHTWTLQGFGMLRLYLSDDVRLHVWDSRYRVDDVTLLHNHPWDFVSGVVAGEITNHLYAYGMPENKVYDRHLIKCGEGGGLTGAKDIVNLCEPEVFHYIAGECYRENAEQIHMSQPADGTVTIIKRSFKDNVDYAHVFCEVGKVWVSAEPRIATDDEIEAITRNALNHWF